MVKIQTCFIALTLVITIIACKKQTDSYAPSTTINQLNPLYVGKTLIYRLDSINSYTSSLLTTSYLAKDTIVRSDTESNGAITFTSNRYITDTLRNGPWVYQATYTTTFNQGKMEWLDQNLRFVNLTSPVSPDNSWNGNIYISANNSPFAFLQNDSHSWNYNYQNLGQPFHTIKGTIPNTYTILQRADSTGVFDPNNFYYITFSKEVYAVGIGLIYKNFLHLNYQTNNKSYVNDSTDYSYGLKLNLVDYK